MISSFPVLKLLVMLSAIYFNFLSTRVFMVSKCYLDSEGESEWLDLPFFIEFNSTSGFLIRWGACIQNLSSHISIIIELLRMARKLKSALPQNKAKIRAYLQYCRGQENLNVSKVEVVLG